MTNQEAREILVGLEAAYRDLDPLAFTDDGIQFLNERIEAVRAAISALEKQDVPDTNVGDTISRQAAIIQLSHNKTGDDDCDVVIQNDIETIKALPPAQPEIIRCKDCKYCDRGIDEDLNPFLKCLGWVYGGTQEEDFCSHAERRTDEA